MPVRLPVYIWLVTLLFGSFIFFVTSKPAFALPQLSQVQVQLNATKQGQPIEAIVCATPSTAVSEGKVAITFPDGFTIDGATSAWKADVDEIPDDLTPWPGIGPTPISVSGKTVTFTSGDLSTTDLYCFHLKSNSSKVNGPTGSVTGSVSTYTTFNFALESRAYAVSVLDNTIQVSATVPADISDMEGNLFVLTGTNPYPENSEIEFEIRYRADLVYNPRGFNVQAQWFPGVMEGTGSEVDVVEYVSGSAEKAYGNTLPIIDTVNRKITWRITELPKNTQYSVKFRLKLNKVYLGPNKINIKVAARSFIGASYTPDSEQTIVYQYSTFNKNVPPPPSAAHFSSIQILSVSNTESTIRVTTNKIVKLTQIRYGKKPNQLTKNLNDSLLSNVHDITLSELEPGTTYYFRVVTTDEDDLVSSSDLYTFKTAALSVSPKINPNSFLITALGSVLLAPFDMSRTNGAPTFLIPQNTPYELRFEMLQGSQIKNIEIITRNDKILGASTIVGDLSSEVTKMAELLPGVFTGRLLSHTSEGTYTQYVRISDFYGNIVETPIAHFRVVKPLTFLDKSSRKPIENLKVKLYVLNPSQKIYELITSSKLALPSILNTLPNGTLNIALPPGHYKIETTGIGYKSMSTEFSVGVKPGDGYPILMLESTPFGIIEYVTYYGSLLSDAFTEFISALESIRISSRYFDLVAFTMLFLSVIVTYFSFHIRTGNPLVNIFHHLPFVHHPQAVMYIGKVIDSHKSPLRGTEVYLIHNHTTRVVDHTKTNEVGVFQFKAIEGNYSYMVIREGYMPVTQEISPKQRKMHVIELDHHPTLSQSITTNFIFAAQSIFGALFEFLLIGSLILQIFFGLTFGYLRVLPFILGTAFNIWLWIRYLEGKQRITTS